jgi:hypothetical protein
MAWDLSSKPTVPKNILEWKWYTPMEYPYFLDAFSVILYTLALVFIYCRYKYIIANPSSLIQS